MPVRHLEHRLAEPLRSLIGIPLAARRAKSAIAPQGNGAVLLAGWAIADETAPLGSFAAQHLLHFCSLYRSYRPSVDVIRAVPVVVVGEDLVTENSNRWNPLFFQVSCGLHIESR